MFQTGLHKLGQKPTKQNRKMVYCFALLDFQDEEKEKQKIYRLIQQTITKQINERKKKKTNTDNFAMK